MDVKTIRKRIIKIYVPTFIVGVLYLFISIFTDFELDCFVLKTTGFECPGCGMTRMFQEMARLNFSEAFSYNPAMFVLFFMWNVVAVLCFLGKPSFIRDTRVLYTLLYITVSVIAFQGVYRIIY